MASTLALFWWLSAADRDARIQGSDALVEALVDQNTDGGLNGPPEEPEPLSDVVTEDDARAAEERLDELNATDVSYSVRRLIRGLASPRENARIGFAVMLSELLSHLPSVCAHDALVLLLKHTVARGNLSGQELRDLQFARLFGVFALIRSGLLFAPTSSLATFQRAFHVLTKVAYYKSWISESCGWVVMQMLLPLASANGSRPPWADEALDWVAGCLAATHSLSPETLALALTLARIAPELQIGARMSPPLKHPCILATPNLTLLAAVLREGASMHLQPDMPPPKPGTWSAKLPFVWDLILETYLEGEAPAEAAPFADFFRVVVDETLFSTQASPERKSWGFQVLHHALQRASAETLPFLFTPNLMRTWVNQLSVTDRLLHSMAQKTVTYVGEAVKRSPTAGMALVTQLMGEHGRPNFDRVTHTKTIESILSSLDEAGIQKYLAYLRNVAYSPTDIDDKKHVASQRQWACDQMLGLVRSNLVVKSDEWIRDVLVFLAGHGYLTLVKSPPAPWNNVLQVPTVPFDEKLQELCRLRLQACLTELKGTTGDGHEWPLLVLDFLKAMAKERKCFKSTATAVAQERIDRALEILKQLDKAQSKKKDDSETVHMQAFKKLVAAVVLISYEDTDDAPDLVDGLVDASKLLFLEKKKKSEIGSMELFVDVLIGLLEISSAFLRAMVGEAFATFSESMTKESLNHLVDQLGLNEESDDKLNEEESMDEEEDAGLEMDEEEEEDDSDDEEEDEEDVDDNDVDPVLRSRVEEAFRASGAAGDEDDEDNDNFDDDQMAQLDDKLAEIFRQHTSSKRREAEIIQRDTALFHNKILDLLEMYAKEQSGNALVMRLVAPLYALSRGSGDVSQQVAHRAGQILRARLCKAKELPRGDLDVTGMVDELKATHEYVRSTQDVRMAELSAAVSQLYTKVLIRHGHLSEPVSVYEVTLHDFLERKSSPVRPSFLLDAIRRLPELGWGLRDSLLDGCRVSKSARAFRQVQAFTMLQAVLQQQQHEETRQVTPEACLDFIKSVRAVVVETIHVAASGDVSAASSLNAQRLKEVLRFALQAVRITVRISDNEADAVHMAWPMADVEGMATALQTSDRFKSSTSLHGLIKEMLAVLRRVGELKEKTKKRTAQEENSRASQSATKSSSSKRAKRAP
ncbi:DNA-directed DNA polymerase [Malassezia caprae]|uniref:DNA-directed DNA polymerase n=1 Tax=Malassezia caprae TaxID=1381934 RepID=A0AAF0E823_9BASI|nr:DNA-directed DNA polymerase [Malassezia caprae]